MRFNHWFRNGRTQPRTRRASRAAAPQLQQLEDRTLPSGYLPDPPLHNGISTTATPPPNLFRAMLSLYVDGAFLSASNLANQFIAANPDEYGAVPSVTTKINASAAAAGVNLNAASNLAGFLEEFRGFQNGLALPNPISPESLAWQDIHLNWPYAGPFALAALTAGADAAFQAVQQPPSSS